MKITTIFNLHEDVWLLHNNSVCEGHVTKINIEVRPGEASEPAIRTTYKVKIHADQFEESYTEREETKLFANRQALLTSLQ